MQQQVFTYRLTREQLAQLIGLTSTTVSRKLHGKVPWTAEEVSIVADFFSIGVEDLMPTREADGSWTPASFVPAYKNAPVPLETGADLSHLRESNSRPIHYE
ncbi:MAG: helix-turn-helix domain-containing protein [Ancrocorticia populi]|uniref:helix-turn-helix domain-containing protein n=1 Tax=Ancrocorticia populi TaxID=2175228 RepID=UPI003F8F2C50